MNMIEASNVCKSYAMGAQKLPVLRNVGLGIGQGEFVAMMGPSGSGKSTLLYVLGGLEKPDSGSVMVCGKEIGKLSDSAESEMRREDIGFVFQAYNLIDNLTAEENIGLPAYLGGKKPREFASRLKELLEEVGLYEHRKHRPMEMSGGQQQRVAIARALINNPKVILADEPTGNLDSKNGREVLELLGKLNSQHGITILMVTHSVEAAGYSSRVIEMKDGQIAKG